MPATTKQPFVLGNLFLRGVLKFKGHTFARLPASPAQGTITMVTDATTTSGTISAGGSTHVSIACFDGSVWKTLLNLA